MSADTCAICGVTDAAVAVDPDPRGPGGALCPRCLAALKQVDYDPARLRHLAEFLKRYERRPGSTVEDNDWVQQIDPEIRRRALGQS